MIEIKITGETAEDVKKHLSELAGLAAASTPPAPAPATRSRKKKELEPEVEQETATETQAGAPETKTEEAAEGQEVTLDQIRALVAEHSVEHRAVMKDKLTELEANNVANLAPEKYGEFFTFLTSLG